MLVLPSLFYPLRLSLSLVIFEALALCHEICMRHIYTNTINFAILLVVLGYKPKINVLILAFWKLNGVKLKNDLP